MDDDEGGFFNLFGGDEEDEEAPSTAKESKVEEKIADKKVKHDGCPLEGDPKGAKVKVLYEGEWFPASIKSYEGGSNSYTISWSSTGVLQYRTKPEDINWDKYEAEVVEQKQTKVDEDELWLAARRGSLKSVKQFVESGVNINETGKSQQRTPFYHAVFCGHADVVEYLIVKGAHDDDGTAFIAANTEIREILNQAGLGKRRGASMRKSHSGKSLTQRSSSLAKKTQLAKTKKSASSVDESAKDGGLVQISFLLRADQVEALNRLQSRLLVVEAAAAKDETQTATREKKISGIDKLDKNGDPKKVTFGEENKPKATAVIKSKKRSTNLFVRFILSLVPRRLFKKRGD